LHYLEECLIESHDENHEVFMMKIVWLSYLHLSNILLRQVEFLSRVVELSFSTRLEFLSSTSQFDSTLFQKNFNSTQHFSNQVLNLNLNTQLNIINSIQLQIFNDEWVSAHIFVFSDIASSNYHFLENSFD